MKDQIIARLRSVEERLRRLRSELRRLKVNAVSQKTLRDEAEALADIWVEELRSPLEHRFKLDPATISKYSDGFRKLHVLSRPNNKVKSYVECLNHVLKDFKDALILPIQQISEPVSGDSKLQVIIAKIPEIDVSDYLTEAVACADSGYVRAGIVMGWCAAIDHVQKKLVMLGLANFNAATTKLKQQTKGRFKRFEKSSE